ncbi:MAG: cell division protein ZapE [Xanthomonadales bacterium]|nr:cell division protein ZapE [Xanthomonadales bacterium]
MSPRAALLDRYREGVAAGRLSEDPAQLHALERLATLAALLHRRAARPWWRRLLGRGTAPRGLYLWGPVGRGKTLLMDLFERELGALPRQRLHFHRFMGRIHAELRERRGEDDPLDRIAAGLARRLELLCLDEFVVVDIGDAMLLAGLLEGLFRRGVTLVATSNQPPRELYRGGLQRARFEPAIALLERHCELVELAGGRDYRLEKLASSPALHVPADAAAEARLEQIFARLAGGPGDGPGTIALFGRAVPYRRRSADLIWFDFAVLCGDGRSTADYLELAQSFHTLFLSRIPRFGEGMDDPARRFIHLVDALYDHGVKLFASAEDEPGMLYRGSRLAAEFARTASRLAEMRTEAYLARPHAP